MNIACVSEDFAVNLSRGLTGGVATLLLGVNEALIAPRSSLEDKVI